MAFHEVQFPIGISRGSSGGPTRLTEIVTLKSGFEQRNSVWADSRRTYNAGFGIQKLQDVYDVLQFFESRRGRLHGFRWKDWSDYNSTRVDVSADITAHDVHIGTGDATETEFQLRKFYIDSANINQYTRTITKPVAGTVLISVDNTVQEAGTDFTVDDTTGQITFTTPPPNNHVIRAGFEFDVPVRFDQDQISISMEQFNVGAIPDINIIEIRV